MGEQSVNGTVRTHIYQLNLPFYMASVVPKTNYNSNIKDHLSQIIIRNTVIIKKFEIL